MELFQVVTRAEACQRLARHWPLPGRQQVTLPLLKTLGRELVRPVVARDDVPGFVRATMDGYAVRAADTFGREDYIRVRLAAGPQGLLAVPVPGGSSLITSMVQADGLVTIPLEEEGLEAGSQVEVCSSYLQVHSP